jgi:hypothetical protein
MSRKTYRVSEIEDLVSRVKFSTVIMDSAKVPICMSLMKAAAHVDKGDVKPSVDCFIWVMKNLVPDDRI